MMERNMKEKCETEEEKSNNWRIQKKTRTENKTEKKKSLEKIKEHEDKKEKGN